MAVNMEKLNVFVGKFAGDSWDGRSSRNTSEVLRPCKAETRVAAHHRPRGSI